MHEMELNGITYKSGLLTPIKQFHIARRLAPVLGAGAKLIPSFQNIGDKQMSDVIADLDLDELAEALAGMADEQSEYVLFGLLECISRKQDQGMGFAPVCRGNSLMFADLNLLDLMKLAAFSFKTNLAGFSVASH